MCRLSFINLMGTEKVLVAGYSSVHGVWIMINPLLAPELRELLEKEDYDSLRDFCSSVEPGMVAEFLGALSPGELWKTLMVIGPQLRAAILAHLDQHTRAGLAGGIQG